MLKSVATSVRKSLVRWISCKDVLRGIGDGEVGSSCFNWALKGIQKVHTFLDINLRVEILDFRNYGFLYLPLTPEVSGSLTSIVSMVSSFV